MSGIRRAERAWLRKKLGIARYRKRARRRSAHKMWSKRHHKGGFTFIGPETWSSIRY